jgi:hypothetical protein
LNQWLPNGLTRDNGPLNDADGDGVKDGEDAVPHDKNLTFAPVHESRYIVIPFEKAPNQPEDGAGIERPTVRGVMNRGFPGFKFANFAEKRGG